MAKDLTALLDQMTRAAAGQTTRQNESLPAVKPVSDIPARSGVGRPGSSGDGGGFAGPLTEAKFSDRKFWPDKTINSSDGLLSFKVAPIKEMKFYDANASALVVNFVKPE